MTRVRQLPLWLRYLIAFGSAAVIFVAIVVWVHAHQNQADGQAANPDAKQAAQEQQEDQVVVEQQQAPHTFRFTTGTAPLKAAGAAVDRYMSQQVSSSLIAGPLDGRASCTAGGGTSGRLLFHCRIHAGAKQTLLTYPFAAVVHPATAVVTYCQVVTPPYPLKAIPLQAACR